ncbi:MAG: hypothetical protein HY455_03515 [Parcubacteria group bacterium]|nr:hypothetical protein [Parcubacteria group bacterium]
MLHLKPHAFLKWGLVAATVIVLDLFFVFGVQLVYETPEYTNFCKQEQVRIVPQKKDECVAVGGQWVDDQFLQKGFPRGYTEPAPIEVLKEGYCDPEFTCRKEFEDAHQLYNRNSFIVLVILGTVALLGSFFLRMYEIVSIGFGLGGILTYIVASMRYWADMPDYLRVGILGLALAALVYAGIRWFGKKEE